METLSRVIVGLGNPGERYSGNRHNVGFLVLDALAREASGIWSADLFSTTCRAFIAGHPVLLVKPSTYMNQSGKAVQALLPTLRKGPEDLVLVVDDLNLPFGRIRVRERGSDGGHHGLESVLTMLGTEEVLRVRVGIGEEQMPEDKAAFVLSDFPPEKRTGINEMMIQTGNAVKSILCDGVSKTMAIFNA